MKKRINKILWYGSELENGKAKVPSVSVEENGLDGLNEGELYISNNEIDPALFIRTSNSKVVRLGEANYKPFKFEYDESIDALVLSRTDGKPAHFLASGALSTRGLGEIEEGGGGTGTGVDLLNIPSDVIPIVGGTYNLGSSERAWKMIYANGGIIGNTYIDSARVIFGTYIQGQSWLINPDGSASFSSLTINGASAATQNWVNSQDFAKISDLSAYVNAEGGTINNATLTGDVTGNGWSIEGGIANFGEVNTDSLYVNGEGVLTSSSLANYVTLNTEQTISGRKTFTGGITASHLYSVEYLDSSVLTINAEEVNFTYDGDDSNLLVALINGYKPLTLGNTSFSPALTSGTVIGTITIGGESKTIFAPNGGSADLSNYVTLDSEQTITGSKYFSGQITSSVADGTAPFVVASKTLVSNLNADRLDGYHESSFFRNKGWVKDLDANQQLFGSYRANSFVNTASSVGQLIAFNNEAGDFQGGQLMFAHDNNLYSRIHWNGSFGDWKQIAFTDSNVATATKLHTARTIAISGAVTGTATSFDGSSNISINTTSVDASKLNGYARVYYAHHPEDEGLLPFIYNDLAYLSEVGGACSIYTTTDTDYTKSDLTKESVIDGSYSLMFDCSPRYQGFSLDSTSTVLVIDIDCPTKFTYGNKFYIDFGNNSWKANEIKVYVWNDAADNTSKVYELKAESSSVPARFMATFSYSYSNGTSTVQGFNKLRVVLTDFARTNPRIAQIGLINMNSFGARMGYVSRGIDDKLYRNFTPAKNRAYNLGSSLNRWLSIYGTNADFTGSVTTQSVIGVSSKVLVISSTNGDLALRRNTDATSVVLNGSAFKPYNEANGLLDLGSTSARWKGIYGQTLDVSGNATVGGETVATQVWVNSQNFVNAEGGTINNAKLTGDVTGNGWSIEGGIANFGEVNTDSLYVNGEGVLTSNSLANYVTLNTEQTISERKTFSKGIIGGLHSIEAPNSVFVGLDSTVHVYGGLTIGTGDLKASSIQSDNILPKSNGSGNIGSSSLKWLNGYINNLHSEVIYADTLTSRTAPYLSVTAASLDLMSCELYGYDSDGNANWNIASNGIASLNSVVISSNDHIHTINGNADGELVIWPSEYLVIENDTITDYAITCSELVQTSDIRYKNILSNVHLKLSDIAAAPTFKFSWANETDGSTHVGTSAQYWQEIAGELVVANKKTGKLGLDYSTAALVSAVSIAREVNTMKMWQTSTTDRIEELEDKVKKLEEENKALRELLNDK